MRACFGKNNGYLLKCHEFDPMKARKKNKKRYIDGCPVVEKCYQAYLARRFVNGNVQRHQQN